MRILTTFSGAVPQQFNTPKNFSFPEGRRCERIRRELTILLSNASGSAYSVTGADFLAMFRAMFTGVTSQFGDAKGDIFDNTLPFDLCRLQSWVFTERDVLVGAPNAASPIPMLELSDYPGVAIQVPGNGTISVVIELPRPFLVELFGEKNRKFCPGWTQMRQFQDQFTTSAWTANAGNVTISGQVTCAWLADDFPSKKNAWVRVIRLARVNSSSLEVDGPAGTMVGVAEITAVGNLTSLGVVTLTTDAGQDIHTQIQTKRIVNQTQYELQEGGLNVQNLATFLFVPDNRGGPDELPTAGGFKALFAAQDLATFQFAWFYIPEQSSSYTEEYVRPNAQLDKPKGLGSTVKATSKDGIIYLSTPSDDNYAIGNGVVWSGSDPTETVVTKANRAAAAQAVNFAIKNGVPPHIAMGHAVANIAAGIPGGHPASGEATNKDLEIANHISPALTAAHGPSIAQSVGRKRQSARG